MAVNLNGIELGGAGSAAPKPAGTPPRAADCADPTTATPPAAEVRITSTAALLASLQQSLAARPAIDQQRVDSLAGSICAGSYVMDPQKIASGVLAAEHVLSSLPRLEI